MIRNESKTQHTQHAFLVALGHWLQVKVVTEVSRSILDGYDA